MMILPTPRYVVTYRNESPVEPNHSPVFEWKCRAVDRDHALTKFHESEDSEGWEVLACTKVRK